MEIDDDILRQAMAASGKSTKKATVEEALRNAVQLHKQARAVKELWGIGWEGDLDEMRQTRFPDWDNGSELEPKRFHEPAA